MAALKNGLGSPSLLSHMLMALYDLRTLANSASYHGRWWELNDRDTLGSVWHLFTETSGAWIYSRT